MRSIIIALKNIRLNTVNNYWYILHIPTNKPVYLPFRRDFEKQPFILYDDIKNDISDCSYCFEGVANKLLRKMVLDNCLNSSDFKVIKWCE